MRYLKIFVLVLIFFLTMVFLFQNQNTLSQEIVLKLNLFAVPEMKSIPLPFYLLTLVSFALGALLTLLVLIWDKIGLTGKLMKANWKVRSLEKDVEKLHTKIESPEKASGMSGLFRKSSKAAAPATGANAQENKTLDKVDDILPPDPDKH